MIDTPTKDRLIVVKEEEAGPYVSVPMSQLKVVCDVLDANHIKYYVDRFYVTVNHEPPVTVVNFRWEANASEIQAILDRGL